MVAVNEASFSVLVIVQTTEDLCKKMHKELEGLVPAGIMLTVMWAASAAYSAEAEAVFRMGGEVALRAFLGGQE